MRYIITFFVIVFFLSLEASCRVVEGTVTSISTNKKGHNIEVPMGNVLISDGYTVCKTDQNGRYSISLNPDATFITLTQPDGYRATPFFQKIINGLDRYDFPLVRNSESVKKRFSFGIVNYADSLVLSNTLKHVGEVLTSRNADFLITAGAFYHGADSLLFPSFWSVVGPKEKELRPAFYSFNWGGVHFVVLSNSSRKAAQAIEWLKSDIEASGVRIPTIIVNNSVLVNGNPILSAGGLSFNMSNYNIKAVVEAGWNANIYDYRGKLATSTIATAPAERGGGDYSPAGVKLVSVNAKTEIATETVLTNVPSKVSLVYPTDTAEVENEKIRIYANAYSSESKIEKVKAGFSTDGVAFRWSELNQLSGWTWSGFLLIANDSTQKCFIRVVATTSRGEVLTDEVTAYIKPFVPDSTRIEAQWYALAGNVEHHKPLAASFRGTLSHKRTVSGLGSTLYSSSLIADSIAITASNYDAEGRSRLAAFNLKTGKSFWFYFTKEAIKNSLAFDRGVVLAADVLGNVYALNVMTGKPVWTIAINGVPKLNVTGGGIAKNGLYYVAIGQSIYAFDIDKGVVAWKTERKNSEGNITTLTWGNGVLLATSNIEGITGYDALSGRRLWGYNDAGIKVYEGNSSFSNELFHLTAGSYYYRFAPQTGEVKCRAKLPFEVSASSVPLVLGDTIMVGTSNSGVVAYNVREDRLLWKSEVLLSIINTLPNSSAKMKTVTASPILVGKYVVFGALDGRVYILNRDNGLAQKGSSLGAPILTTAAVAKDFLIFSDFSGNLSVFKLNL